MAKYGSKFEFNGKSSEDYGVILASVGETNSYEMGLDRSIIRGEINKYRTQVNHLGTKYADVLLFEFTIVKNPCDNANQKDMMFTRSEIRNINAWLTGPEIPKILHFYDSDEYVDYFAIISNVTDNAIGDKIYSLTFSVTCDSPFGYSELITKTISSTSSMTSTITNLSDDISNYVYPIITITPNVTGTVTIKNTTDEEQSISISVKKGLEITVNCKLQTFYDSIGLLDLADIGLSDEFDIYIPRLLCGDNSITITGNCSATFKYRYPKKVGAY